MPNYETPQPVSVTVDLGVAELRIAAADRTDTVVDVHPADAADESDVKAAQQVRVDYSDGVLRITGPKARAFDFSRKTRAVEVTVALPTGSNVNATVQGGHIRGTGGLGECRFKTSFGNVRVEHTGPLRAETAAGDVSVDGVAGDAEISTGTGKVEVGEVDGVLVVKNSNGDTVVDAAEGDVRVRAANGSITVGRAGAGVDAKSSNGAIRLGEVARGSVVVHTAAGDLDVGIAEGTAAWLEVNTGFGAVTNLLEAAGRPAAADETVEVRARTSYGDITIRRA